MPKKSTPVRSGAQRSKPKASKGFELVRPSTQESELVEVEQPRENESRTEIARPERAERDANESKATATVTRERVEDIENGSVVPQRRSRGRTTQGTQGAQRVSEFASLPAVPREKRDEVAEDTEDMTSTTSTAITPATTAKGTASERLAARRQGTQKVQRRNVAALVTAEHYSYVRRDLKFIAVLAIIMFIILAVLYFVPGI